MNRPPPTVAEDSRGIIDPGLLQQLVTVNRYSPDPALQGLIDCFWVVSYRLPAGLVHRQRILSHPCVNLSVAHGQAGDDGSPGPLEVTLTGVPQELYVRRLAGTGWAVAAKSTPGGFGAFVPGSVAELTGQVLAPGRILGSSLLWSDEALIAEMLGLDERGRVAVLENRLTEAVETADPDRIRTARDVAAVAGLARDDRSVRRLDDLAARSGIGVRTLQRLFSEYVGVSPTWVLRRYRLMEVAETVRDGRSVSWAQVAGDLGYSDQAHLIRDFRAVVGTTPAAYAAQQYSF